MIVEHFPLMLLIKLRSLTNGNLKKGKCRKRHKPSVNG